VQPISRSCQLLQGSSVQGYSLRTWICYWRRVNVKKYCYFDINCNFYLLSVHEQTNRAQKLLTTLNWFKNANVTSHVCIITFCTSISYRRGVKELEQSSHIFQGSWDRCWLEVIERIRQVWHHDSRIARRIRVSDISLPMTSPVLKCKNFSLRFDKVWNKVWKSVTKYDRVRQRVTKCDNVWQRVTKCDKVWQSVTKCDKVWQSVTKCDQKARIS